MTTNKYIYAVIDTVGDIIYGQTGLNGAMVRGVAHGPFTAIVSDIPAGRIRPERKNLAAHNAVVKSLMAVAPGVLPVAFGTLANNAQAVRKVLEKNKVLLAQELDKVRGKVELGLRVTLEVPNLFQYMVNSQPELAALRDRLYGKPHGPSQMDQIELGSTFDRLLDQDRERYTEAVIQVLDPICEDIKQIPPREGEVMNLACLVDREAQHVFEEGVCEAANLFDNNFSFDFNGPWAPHNFVHINLTP